MSQHGCPERLSDMGNRRFPEDGGNQLTMVLLVETLTGTAFEMTVSPSDTIFEIKSRIFRVEGIPVSQQHLLYNLKELDDTASLHDYSISDGARLRLVLGMRGGPISTRRLPPPPEPWRDIERLLDSNREEGEWGSVGSGGSKVTVVVFRDGERVNMVRVRENHDGTYSPLLATKYSSSLTHLVETDTDDGLPGSLQENAVTMGKMLDLRRRMETLSVQRRRHYYTDKAEIQKTRSEETLSVPSLLDDASNFTTRTYTPYSEAEDTFTPLYDGNYTRYDYDCSFADRYTLLPPIRTRTDSDQSVHDAVADSERLKLSDALAGSILVKNGRDREDKAAILEECLDTTSVEECHIRQDSPQLSAKSLAPIPTAEYDCLGVACGAGAGVGRWWRGFGSSSALPPPAGPRAAPAAVPPPALPPGGAGSVGGARLFASTSDLETLHRTRLLPALSRHRNREHLHLSDDGLDRDRERDRCRLEVGSERRARRLLAPPPAPPAPLAPPPPPAPEPAPPPATPPAPPAQSDVKLDEKIKKLRCGWCRKRLSIATVHRCRCGHAYCAPHRYQEVHGCAYDYKRLQPHADPHAQPQAHRLHAPKLPKI